MLNKKSLFSRSIHNFHGIFSAITFMNLSEQALEHIMKTGAP